MPLPLLRTPIWPPIPPHCSRPDGVPYTYVPGYIDENGEEFPPYWVDEMGNAFEVDLGDEGRTLTLDRMYTYVNDTAAPATHAC